MKYNQTEIIKKINCYLKEQKRDIELNQGYCHGLTLLWLYKMSENNENWYYNLVRKIVNAPDSKLSEIEIDVEKFIAHIEWLQQPEKYVPSIRQLDIDETIEVPKEIPVSSIFEPDQLDKILELVIKPNKMIYISGPDHSIGVIHRGDKYYLYDPNYNSGTSKILTSIHELRLELVQCLFTEFNHPEKKLAVIINVLGEDDMAKKRDEIYTWIIDKTGSMNFCDYGIGPLYLACENNGYNLAKMLLEKKAEPNIKTKSGKLPLVLCSYSGYTDLVRLLLSHKANPNKEGREGLPLYLAAKHNHVATMLALLKGGADINKPDSDGDTAIFGAVEASHLKATKILLENGADPLRPRRDGDTAMDIAIEKGDFMTVSLMLGYIKVPHKRNIKALRSKSKYIKAYADFLMDKDEVTKDTHKKIVEFVVNVSSNKTRIIQNIKNPIQSRRASAEFSKELQTMNNRLFSPAEQLVVSSRPFPTCKK